MDTTQPTTPDLTTDALRRYLKAAVAHPMDQVTDFHLKMGVRIGQMHSGLPSERLALRKKLIDEELAELFLELEDAESLGLNWQHIYKEFVDLLYVTYGLAVELGMNKGLINMAFQAVHDSNLSKLGLDGRPVLNPDGKITKGPNYAPPDLSFIRA